MNKVNKVGGYRPNTTTHLRHCGLDPQSPKLSEVEGFPGQARDDKWHKADTHYKALGTLYVVATPIGNLEELSPRALRIMSEVDVIAAEDTRTTGLLLSRLLPDGGAKRPKLFSHHKFNEAATIDGLLKVLFEGKNVALLSDAGTPCISDPGHMLVNAAAKQGIEVVGVGGSCAAIMALSVSGFPAELFIFLGFLPRKAGERLAALERWSFTKTTLIFYESPKRIAVTLECFAEHFPETALCLCNDLTKKYERIYRGTPSEILEELQANPFSEKGEYTCVAHLPEHKTQETQEAQETQSLSLESLLVDVMIKQGCSLKDAMKIVSENSAKIAKNSTKAGISKKELYAASLHLKGLF